MNTKLTLRLNETLIRRAKGEALKRGKSVSQMVADYFGSLAPRSAARESLPPVTRSLFGLLKGKHVAEEDYRRHLREKHL